MAEIRFTVAMIDIQIMIIAFLWIMYKADKD